MDNEQKQALWEQFKALGANAMGMNHYDLARMTSIRDVQLWKSFLTDPEVSAYIDQETQILTQAELRKLASDVSDSRSVGQAQLINAMQKLTENKTTKANQTDKVNKTNKTKTLNDTVNKINVSVNVFIKIENTSTD